MYLYPKTLFEMKPTNKSKSSIDQRAKAKTPNNLSQQQHQHPLAGLSDRKPAKAENISGPCTTLFQNDAC